MKEASPCSTAQLLHLSQSLIFKELNQKTGEIKLCKKMC